MSHTRSNLVDDQHGRRDQAVLGGQVAVERVRRGMRAEVSRVEECLELDAAVSKSTQHDARVVLGQSNSGDETGAYIQNLLRLVGRLNDNGVDLGDSANPADDVRCGARAIVRCDH